jgi:hypothetical protein
MVGKTDGALVIDSLIVPMSIEELIAIAQVVLALES